MQRSEFETLRRNLQRHREVAARFVLLPFEGAPHSYEIVGEATVYRAALDWDRSHGRSENTVPDGRAWSVRAFSAVSGARAVVLQSHTGGEGAVVHGYSLSTGERIGAIRTPLAASVKALQLVGDFIFAGGNGLGFHFLQSPEVVWRPIHLPAEIAKIRKTVDFLALSGETLWAVDDEMVPLYAAAYDLRSLGFARAGEVHRIDGHINPHVVDFACSDEFLVTLLQEGGGWSATRRVCSISRAGRLTPLAEISHRLRAGGAAPRDFLRAVGVVGSTAVAALSGAGIGVLHLADVPPPGSRVDLQWDAVIGAPGSVTDVICVQNPPRVYAVVDGGARAWEFSLDTGTFVDLVGTPR